MTRLAPRRLWHYAFRAGYKTHDVGDQRPWIADVVNFKTPVGSLSALLVLTAYLFVSTIVVFAGVQLDELLGTSTGRRARSLIQLARTASER